MLPHQASGEGHWPIEDGTLVYGSGGEKVGTVRNYDSQMDYLDVQKGWLFTKDFYVPMSEVAAITGEGVTLHLTKEQLEDDRYGTPPRAAGAVDERSSQVTEWTMTHRIEPSVDRDLVTEVKTHDGDFYE